MNIKAISIAVNYLDLLSYTWSLNKDKLDNYVIITSDDDLQTIEFCKDNDIEVFTTDAFHRNGAKFNKAAALNDYFLTLDINTTEWILLLDSDIVVNDILSIFKYHYNRQSLDSIIIPNDLSMLPSLNGQRGIPLNLDLIIKQKFIYKNDAPETHAPYDVKVDECLFGCHREIYNTKDDYKNKIFEFEKCSFYGYFQLFHINCIKDELEAKQSIFLSFDTASVYDMIFAREYWSFPQQKTLNLSVHHLGPIGSNWEGRKTQLWN